jgi:hypothetical protein
VNVAAEVPASRGIDPGSYSIAGLQSNKKIKVFAFSDQVVGYYSYQGLILPSGISKKEVVIDVSLSFSDPAFQQEEVAIPQVLNQANLIACS